MNASWALRSINDQILSRHFAFFAVPVSLSFSARRRARRTHGKRESSGGQAAAEAPVFQCFSASVFR
jgi:hypothetical protein